MSHVDAMGTRFIDLSIRPALAGYADSVALIARLAHDLGMYGLRDAASDAAEAIAARHVALRSAVVEPSADEWDDALHDADYALALLEQHLYYATRGAWLGSPYNGFYVVAPTSWWDALEV